MNNLEKFKTAPNPVDETKFNMFLPIKKNVSKLSKRSLDTIYTICDNSKYKVQIKGHQLTQIHRDILDIINYLGDSSFDGKSKDKRAIRFFTLYQIQKHLKYKTKRNSKWVEKKIDELQLSVIKIYDKVLKKWVQINILDVFDYSEQQGKYGIIYSKYFMDYFSNQISINYKDYLFDLLDLKNPQTKAIVRYLLTFKDGHNISLDNALINVGIDKNKTQQNFDYHKRQVIAEKDTLEKIFNIKLHKKTDDNRKTDYTLIYTRLKNVDIYYPLKANQKPLTMDEMDNISQSAVQNLTNTFTETIPSPK